MPLRREELPIQLQNIWSHIGSTDWSSNEHEWAKSYVCSLFSWLAYFRILPTELERAKTHAIIVPSELYQNILQQRRIVTVDELAGPLDLAAAFEVIGTRILILGIKVKNLIFVAVRGTADLYDFWVDVNFFRRRAEEVAWHRGFHSLAIEHLDELTTKLREIRKDGDIIYITGHSMGGAVAGILHAIWRDSGPVSHMGLTFGTPRYASRIARDTIKWPIQHFHSSDYFTYVPPKLFGYTNIPIAYQTNAGTKAGYTDSTAFVAWGAQRLSGSRFPRSHYIENYRRDIGLRLGFDDETNPYIRRL